MNHGLMCLALILSVSAFLPGVSAAQEGAKEEFDAAAAKMRDAKKTAEDPTCVFPEVKDGAAIIEYVKGKLAEVGAPKELDVSISFSLAVANVKLVDVDSKEFLLSWKLPSYCTGDIIWLSEISPAGPQWLGKLRSAGFVGGMPLTPKKITSFQGDPYAASKNVRGSSSQSTTEEGAGSSDEESRVPIGLAMVAGALLLWVLRGVFQKKGE